MTVQRAKTLLAGLLLWASHPTSLWACAACYGQSDSPMARGMNWGIFSLLAVVVCVLASIATFFVYLGVRTRGATLVEGVLLKSSKVQKVGRVTPCAPSHPQEDNQFCDMDTGCGAHRVTRPTITQLGQHAIESAPEPSPEQSVPEV